MEKLELQYLDHVAIRVKDMSQSIQWYEEVLGLRKIDLPKWKGVPIFMLAGKTGLAIFPAQPNAEVPPYNDQIPGIDHFAFHVDQENFERAKVRYQALNIPYQFKDHHYYQSLYVHDPDGHIVELTTLMMDIGL